jgi:hypothetical protein
MIYARSTPMIGTGRVVGAMFVCLLAAGLGLVAGCEWVTSQETLDLSGFKNFEYQGTITDVWRVEITEKDGTYSAWIGVKSNGAATDYETALTADQIDTMRDIFSRVVREEVASVGEACPPTGAFYTFAWDELTLEGHGCKPIGVRVRIGQDSFTEILDFLANLAGVRHPV